ncbi:MAG: YCF48-related protein [Ignavibacteria bacterium]
MKHFDKLILMLITIIALTSNAFSQSEWVLKSTAMNLNAVFFMDEFNGYIAGDSGTILATVDGGSNWQCVTSGTSKSLKSIYFINSLTGWIAGSGGIIVKTTNGGSNWISLSTGTAINLTGIYFPTIDTGYAIGSSYTIKTTNGGSSWTALLVNSGSAIYFSTALKGLSTNSTHYVSKTVDGGASWSENTAPGNPVNQNDLTFINANTGWTAGGNKIYVTTNAGNNWVTQTTSAPTFATLYCIDFTDEMNGHTAGYSGFFSGDSAMIFSTTNGGTNWVAQGIGTNRTLRGIDFVDDMTGWVVGDAGYVSVTTNGGATWKNQLIQYTAPFTQGLWIFDVEFRNEMTGWMSTMDGYVNKTTNGGENWTTISTASFNYLYSICFPDENDTGWACGRLGTIQKTENAGVNWFSQTSGTSQHLNSIVVDNFGFPATNIGWCVGNGGTILGYGLIWVALVSPTTNDLNSVFPLDQNHVFIAGSAGTILETTDAGLNWMTKTSGTTEDLKSIYFINSSTGYVCGTNGTLKISTDGGDFWFDQSSGTTSTLHSIDFEETITDNGYAVGEDGTILSTSNGGTTWIKESSGGSTPLFSVLVKEVPTLTSTMTTVVKAVGKLGKYIDKQPVTALPVELTFFSFSKSLNTVILNWQTLNEINNKGFDIERSDSKNGWNRIGFVEGNGNVSGLSNYTFNDNRLSPDKYKYRLKQIDFNGSYEYFNLSGEVVIGQPEGFELKQNYPNPFNPTTTIEYLLPADGNLKITIYDISGKEVMTLVNEFKNAGYHEIKFNGSSLASGNYFYKMSSGNFNVIKSMILIK